jgi:predicted transcriptional regulator of viral defense system
MELKDISTYVDQLQSRGRYSFLKSEAQAALHVDDSALVKALWRLEQRNRIRTAKRGFYVIVPLEYASTGILPPEWFIADLMKYMEQPYYVGLLSAAALHGAAHQQPQEFHVVVPSAHRNIRIDPLQIRFFKKGGMESSPVQDSKTPTGFIKVSDPAVTAMDLVAYAGRVGGLDRVLTILQELSEKITQHMLVEAAKKENQLSHIQRLGWLLEKAGQKQLAEALAGWLMLKEPKRTPLDPAGPRAGFPRDEKWNVVLNADVEGEL